VDYTDTIDDGTVQTTRSGTTGVFIKMNLQSQTEGTRLPTRLTSH
jgi:hypothetical protein